MQTMLDLEDKAGVFALAKCVGVSAARYLDMGGLLGSVCASFRRSCYVQTCDGEVVCIAGEDLGRGPLTVSVRLPDGTDLRDAGVVESTPVFVEGERLLVGTLELWLPGTVVWQPQAPCRAADGVAEARNLAENLGAEIPRDGLGCLLPHVEILAAGRRPVLDDSNAVAGMACDAIAGLVKGLQASDIKGTDGGVRGLLGLGPGLTPSGDDLLVGMLLVLKARESPASAVLGDSVTRQAHSMTGVISASMLGQAVLGLGSEASLRLIAALLQEHSAGDVSRRARTLASVGHTSGWDTLAGIVLGVHIARELGR